MEEKKRRMNIILGIILQIYFLFPWMNITGERKNFIMYVIEFTIAEFQDLEAEVIMELIEGEPLVSKVSTEPGETNQTFHDKITGNNTENTELGEGTIFFDMIFYVRMKDGVSRIINLVLNRKD